MLKRFESISLGQGQGPKAHGVGRGCVPQGLIFGVYNCCFMLFPLFCWENLRWSKDVFKLRILCFGFLGFVVFFGNYLAFEDDEVDS